MEHFYENIEGWFSYDYIYRHVANLAEDGDLFVEVGSFKGRSSAFLAVELINTGKKVQLDLVDTWAGGPEHQLGGECEVKEVVDGTLFDTFTKNMKSVEGFYNVKRMTSVEAAATYNDNSIDFIMIDGDHRYEAVKADILAFLPKMKDGGIMAGDDAYAEEIRRAATETLGQYNVQFPNNIHFYAVINRSK